MAWVRSHTEAPSVELHRPRSGNWTGESVQLRLWDCGQPNEGPEPPRQRRKMVVARLVDRVSTVSLLTSFLPLWKLPRVWEAVGCYGVSPWGRGSTSGLSNWVMLFAQHSVLLVGCLTDSCALFVPAYPACSSSFTLGPLSVETKHFLAWVRLFS